MPHILVAGAVHPAGLAALRADPHVTFDYVEDVSEESYAPLIGKADALVIRTQPLSAATVAKGERLKVVSRHGVGYDAVDLAALNARGIALMIVGDTNSLSVAEHAMMMLLACAKRTILADKAVRDPARWGWRNRLEIERDRRQASPDRRLRPHRTASRAARLRLRHGGQGLRSVA